MKTQSIIKSLFFLSLFLLFVGCSKEEDKKLGVDNAVGTVSVSSGLTDIPLAPLFQEYKIVLENDTIGNTKLINYFPMTVTVSKVSESVIDLLVKYNTTTDNKTFFEFKNISFTPATESDANAELSATYNILLNDAEALKHVKFQVIDEGFFDEEKTNKVYPVINLKGTIKIYSNSTPIIDFDLYIQEDDEETETEVFSFYAS